MTKLLIGVLTLSLAIGISSLMITQKKKAPTLLGISPNSHLLPENHLRFYVYFSEPMEQGFVYNADNIELFEGTKPIHFAFQHTELWNLDYTRLTLFLHPARQKTDLRHNISLGRVLQEGNNYRLHIKPQLYSAKGVPLKKGFTFHFKAGPEERSQIDPRKWVLTTPILHSHNPLKIQFKRVMDDELISDKLYIFDSNNKKIQGNFKTIKSKHCTFTPRQPWSKSNYQLRINPELEDSCANNCLKSFEMNSKTPAFVPIPYIDFKLQKSNTVQYDN